MIAEEAIIVSPITKNIGSSPMNPNEYPTQYADTQPVSRMNRALFEHAIILDLLSILSKTNKEINVYEKGIIA